MSYCQFDILFFISVRHRFFIEVSNYFNPKYNTVVCPTESFHLIHLADPVSFLTSSKTMDKNPPNYPVFMSYDDNKINSTL